VLLYMACDRRSGKREATSLPGADRVRVAMLGGDERELVLLKSFLDRGFHVVAAGFPELPGIGRFDRAGSVHEAVTGADAVVCPMSNTDHEGVIKACLDPHVRLVLDEKAFSLMGEGTPLFIGA